MNTNNPTPLDPRDQNLETQPVNTEENQQDSVNTETDWELTGDDDADLQDEAQDGTNEEE